jgi:hypothetical protein
MAGLMTTFATAPRLKLYIQDKAVAYAVGFNINVSVDVQPIYIIGQAAPVSLEPTMYNPVTGVLQIVRLLSGSTRDLVKGLANGSKNSALTGTSDSQTSEAEFAAGLESSTPGASTVDTNSLLSQSSLFQHLTPEQLLISRSFDIVVHMKVPKTGATSAPFFEEKAWLVIKDCRITSRNTNIAMGQIVNEPLSFQGLLATHSSDTGVAEFQLDSAVKQTGG